MENLKKGPNMMLEVIFKISAILLNAANIAAKTLEMYRDKKEHQKSNRTDQS